MQLFIINTSNIYFFSLFDMYTKYKKKRTIEENYYIEIFSIINTRKIYLFESNISFIFLSYKIEIQRLYTVKNILSYNASRLFQY